MKYEDNIIHSLPELAFIGQLAHVRHQSVPRCMMMFVGAALFATVFGHSVGPSKTLWRATTFIWWRRWLKRFKALCCLAKCVHQRIVGALLAVHWGICAVIVVNRTKTVVACINTWVIGCHFLCSFVFATSSAQSYLFLRISISTHNFHQYRC